MAHHTEQVGFPAIPLNPGMKLRLRALSPTADSAIVGVTATVWSIYGYDEAAGLADVTADAPHWVAQSEGGG